MGKPYRRLVGNNSRCSRPGHNRSLVQVVMEHDVVCSNPPDQGVATATFASCVPLWTVEVDADVGPIRDFQPEPLSGITFPPRVDLARFAQSIRTCGGRLGGRLVVTWGSELSPEP